MAGMVLISPVYDYVETGYIGNMQLPPQPHRYYTHIDGELCNYALRSSMAN